MMKCATGMIDMCMLLLELPCEHHEMGRCALNLVKGLGFLDLLLHKSRMQKKRGSQASILWKYSALLRHGESLHEPLREHTFSARGIYIERACRTAPI